MATSFDPADFVDSFLQDVDANFEHLPDPFDYNTVQGGITAAELPVRLLGKLKKLQEAEQKISQCFIAESGTLTQRLISAVTAGNTVHHSQQAILDRKEDEERSTERERWFCDLTDEEKAIFDQYCLKIAGPDFKRLLPEELPSILQGALARLALEAAAIARRYRIKCANAEKSLDDRGLANHTVKSPVLKGVDVSKKEAVSRLIGRWYRELTPEQQAALDEDAFRAKPAADPEKIALFIDRSGPKTRDLLKFLWDEGRMPARRIDDAMNLLKYRVSSAKDKKTFRQLVNRANNQLNDPPKGYEVTIERKEGTIQMMKLDAV